MNDKKPGGEPVLGIKSSMWDGLRQLQYPDELRIDALALPTDALELVGAEMQPAPVVQAVEPSATPAEGVKTNKLVAELATCLWYLKTKHFKRAWNDTEIGDDDPRVRRALGRLNKSIDTLKEGLIEVHDPTNERYPQGGEGMMRPIQFLPTAGLNFEMVTETVAPIVYRDDRLIQRGDVFVAVPKEDVSATPTPAATVTSTEVEPVAATAKSTPLETEPRTAILPAESDSEAVGVTVANEHDANESGTSSRGTDSADGDPQTTEVQVEDGAAECSGADSASASAGADATPATESDEDGDGQDSEQEPTDKSN